MKSRAIICLSSEQLALYEAERSEKIPLRESTPASIAKKVSSFWPKPEKIKPLLILSRSKVLQKEILLAPNASRSLKDKIEERLRELLPLPSHQMAYAISLPEVPMKTPGLLFAIPEKRINEILEFLSRVGLFPDDIVTEDQTLAWFQSEEEPCLILDWDGARLLCVFAQDGQLRFSRSYAQISTEDFQDKWDEISFLLLETGLKPQKVALSGDWETAWQNAIRRHFLLPVTQWETKGDLPAVIAGANRCAQFKVASLLPSSKKIEKVYGQRKRDLSRLFLAGAIFIFAIVFSFGIFALKQVWDSKREEGRLKALRLETVSVRKIETSLQQWSEAQASKVRWLDFLKSLNAKMPAGIKVQELEIENQGFLFRAESSTHAQIGDCLQSLSGLPEVARVQMTHTRLRRRLNQDFFEFEVTGNWK